MAPPTSPVNEPQRILFRRQFLRQNTHNLGHWLLNALFPPSCLSCATATYDHPGLCTTCWDQLSFVLPPFCPRCCMPLDHLGSLCLECVRNPPPFAAARAALYYNERSGHLVMALKNRARYELVPLMSQWMNRAGDDLLKKASIIVPVPLHWTRLARRTFNQSALLAQSLARARSLSYQPHLLRRHRRTPSQAQFRRSMRFRNVKGAFSLHPKWKGKIADQTLLLIDDVHTSGATLRACAAVLKNAGATPLALTLCRTPNQRPPNALPM